MITKIAWGITGAGCWLLESFEVLGKLIQNSNIEIDLFFSEAGREVAQCYGVFKPPVPIKSSYIDQIREFPNFNQDIFKEGFIEKYQWSGSKEKEKIEDYIERVDQKPSKNSSNGEFDFDEAFNDVIFEIDEGSSNPSSSSASIGKYDFVVISPATGNTVAKIFHGIADSLITNLAILANKSEKTKIIIAPTDFKAGKIRSYLPIILHQNICGKCSECSALWACKPGAIRRRRGKVKINRLKCIGCLDCVKYCRQTIITFLEEAEIIVRKREEDIVAQLSTIEGFTVFQTPGEVYQYLMNHIK